MNQDNTTFSNADCSQNDSPISFINETVECAHDLYNQQLVLNGRAKNIAEASAMQRDIICNCAKCKTLKR
jgi:hypothetical protein